MSETTTAAAPTTEAAPELLFDNSRDYNNFYNYCNAYLQLLGHYGPVYQAIVRDDPSLATRLSTDNISRMTRRDIDDIIFRYNDIAGVNFSSRNNAQNRAELNRYSSKAVEMSNPTSVPLPSTIDREKAVYDNFLQTRRASSRNQLNESNRQLRTARRANRRAGWRVFGNLLLGAGAVLLTATGVGAVGTGIYAALSAALTAGAGLASGAFLMTALAVWAVVRIGLAVVPRMFRGIRQRFQEARENRRARKQALREARQARNQANARYQAANLDYTRQNSYERENPYPGARLTATSGLAASTVPTSEVSRLSSRDIEFARSALGLGPEATRAGAPLAVTPTSTPDPDLVLAADPVATPVSSAPTSTVPPVTGPRPVAAASTPEFTDEPEYVPDGSEFIGAPRTRERAVSEPDAPEYVPSEPEFIGAPRTRERTVSEPAAPEYVPGEGTFTVEGREVPSETPRPVEALVLGHDALSSIDRLENEDLPKLNEKIAEGNSHGLSSSGLGQALASITTSRDRVARGDNGRLLTVLADEQDELYENAQRTLRKAVDEMYNDNSGVTINDVETAIPTIGANDRVSEALRQTAVDRIEQLDGRKHLTQDERTAVAREEARQESLAPDNHALRRAQLELYATAVGNDFVPKNSRGTYNDGIRYFLGQKGVTQNENGEFIVGSAKVSGAESRAIDEYNQALRTYTDKETEVNAQINSIPVVEAAEETKPQPETPVTETEKQSTPPKPRKPRATKSQSDSQFYFVERDLVENNADHLVGGPKPAARLLNDSEYAAELQQDIDAQNKKKLREATKFFKECEKSDDVLHAWMNSPENKKVVDDIKKAINKKETVQLNNGKAKANANRIISQKLFNAMAQASMGGKTTAELAAEHEHTEKEEQLLIELGVTNYLANMLALREQGYYPSVEEIKERIGREFTSEELENAPTRPQPEPTEPQTPTETQPEPEDAKEKEQPEDSIQVQLLSNEINELGETASRMKKADASKEDKEVNQQIYNERMLNLVKKYVQKNEAGEYVAPPQDLIKTVLNRINSPKHDYDRSTALYEFNNFTKVYAAMANRRGGEVTAENSEVSSTEEKQLKEKLYNGKGDQVQFEEDVKKFIELLKDVLQKEKPNNGEPERGEDE